jgi:hypothetical protein
LSVLCDAAWDRTKRFEDAEIKNLGNIKPDALIDEYGYKWKTAQVVNIHGSRCAAA